LNLPLEDCWRWNLRRQGCGCSDANPSLKNPLTDCTEGGSGRKGNVVPLNEIPG